MTANLFLVSAPRAGSTQLAHWLGSHPDIALPRIKEPNHFSAHEFDPAEVQRRHLNDVDPAQFIAQGQPRSMQFAVFRQPAHYAALFEHLPQRYRLDASTSYLSCPEAPTRIHKACPGARIILLTRDPLNRAVSHYHLARRTGRTQRPLGAELRDELEGRTPLFARYLVRPSRQSEGCARFRKVFAPSNVLSLRFEEMIASPDETLKRLSDWLSIPAEGFDLARTARNASAAPRFAWLNTQLHHSGLKTLLRSTLPQGVKRRLKPIWFSSTVPTLPEADLAALRAALQ